MFFLNKLNNNYFIYLLLIFVFVPLNYIPQLYDGVIFNYTLEIGKFKDIDFMFKDTSRYFYFYNIYLIEILSKITSIPAEIFLDNLVVLILILLCIEVKKYSKLLFNLEDRWCNLAALFTAIFPIWHTAVAFNVAQYIISIYCLFFGYRYLIQQKKIKILIGLIFIFLSFDYEVNMSFLLGLAFIHLILNKKNKLNDTSISKLISIIFICVVYYVLKTSYFPPSGYYGEYNKLTWNLVKNLAPSKLFNNILNYSSYLLLYIWIPLIFYLNVLIKDKKKLLKINENFKFDNNYFLLIILSAFAIFPYLLINRSSTIFYLADYYQRNAFLLAPICGIFFAIMFRDMSKINIFQNKINLNLYLMIFIFINLVLLNYGNLRKIEAYHFKKNLIVELKNYGLIPKGDVQIVSKNLPSSLRNHEVSHIFYKAYNIAGWWGTTSLELKDISDPPSYSGGKSIVIDDAYSIANIVNDYVFECKTHIFLKNDLKKIDRFKKLYVFNYKKYYKIDKVLKKC